MDMLTEEKKEMDEDPDLQPIPFRRTLTPEWQKYDDVEVIGEMENGLPIWKLKDNVELHPDHQFLPQFRNVPIKYPQDSDEKLAYEHLPIGISDQYVSRHREQLELLKEWKPKRILDEGETSSSKRNK